ncbi:ABC transporter ATP-binding protein [Planococcus sp. ISL-109]|uniref:ATP-binding cassette domain-containing protein n=1 Tax=Planococcus sp. ISL-109 TaxID=2819166 RepID=UPI001BE7B10E|nr:ABC transporter ATP-binding protein [Planococcus sp. ISL-109]MBT2583260.1 ABC transporter ATP-binding protein [Planococcus sp. ISL-109]
MRLKVDRLTKVYKGGQGIRDLKLELKAGEITALTGANGAGKSTLLRLLTKEEEPTSGMIDWCGDETVNVMPDELQFPPELRAGEVIHLLAALKKLPASEEERVLRRVGLYDVRVQKVSRFSKGMRQRLNLAQCLLGPATLLLLDEPTNALDVEWIARLQDILEEERALGKTILFTTHLERFAEEAADRIVKL